MGDALLYRVSDIFRLSGPDTVLTGRVESGSVRLGDRVVIRSPNGVTVGRVIAVEKDRTFLRSASCGDAVALGVRVASLAPVADGFEKREGFSYCVTSLVIEAPERAWWQFWQPWA